MYDPKGGYLGIGVSSGKEMLKVTPFDRILFLRKNGFYTVSTVPDKIFVDTGLWFVDFADKETLSKVLFTVIYRDNATHYAYIKRCRIEQYIMNRDYLIVPDGTEVLHVDTRTKFKFTVHYTPKPRIKTLEETFKAQDYAEKGVKALGVRLSVREAENVTVEGVAGADLFSS
jgi:topoisomerase-4 subunit A